MTPRQPNAGDECRDNFNNKHHDGLNAPTLLPTAYRDAVSKTSREEEAGEELGSMTVVIVERAKR